MYECYRGKTVVGKESFPLPWILGENLFYAVMWILAGYLLWSLWRAYGIPLLTILWALLVVGVQVLLKKHNCSGCYYYDKWCHLGWGKVSSGLCAQDSGNQKLGMKLALFYILPPPIIFIASFIYAIFGDPGWIYWCALILFLALNVVSFPLRKKGCGLCAMRECCAGSATRTEKTPDA